ncbi:MAG: RhuM family protein, partial [Campylobacterota bacterium]|nr:RhuM family protein [Campylobacterota bacterium]
WLTQNMIAELFDTTKQNISLHIKNIFEGGELEKVSVVKDFLTTAKDGKNYKTKYYNLDAIISIGYRVNSKKATQFRQWATSVLKEFAIKGFVLDKKRLENGTFLGKNYFDTLLEEIREIRLSERMFYQKVTDIYATSVDYNKNDETTKKFFAKVQNKLHFAIHGHTAAELIYSRVDNQKEKMGLTSWDNSPSLDMFLEFDERDILQDAGKITKKIADEKAFSEFEKYRVIQDRLFMSDFDKLLLDMDNYNE